MALPAPRPITDLGIRIPDAIPLPLDPDLMRTVAENAAMTRGSGLALIKEAIARDPAIKLAAILMAVKLLAFGRSDQNLALLKRDNARIACGAGCAACCHQDVEATIPEAILVAAQIGGEADPRHDAILAEAEASLNDAPGQRLPRPCPLLRENRCSVYEVRPLACRAVFSPDATRCHDALASLQRGETSSDNNADIYTAPLLLSRGDQAGVLGICKDLGLQYDMVHLARTVATILRDPTTVDRWLAGKKVFPALAAVATAQPG